MEITVAEQGLFLLPAQVTPDQAKEKAWEQKTQRLWYPLKVSDPAEGR